MKKFLIFFAVCFALSCTESTKGPMLVVPEVYEVTTLNSAKTNGLSVGMLSQVDLNNIGSMVTDSKGNIFMADRGSQSIKKLSPDGKITERQIEGKFGNEIPQTLSISADDELQILTLYQNEEHLFYYAKNDDPIKAFSSPFPKKGIGFTANTSAVYKKADGKYLVVNNDKLYMFTNDKTFSDLKMPISIDGNQLQGNVAFLSPDEKLYYIPDGLYDSGDPFVKLKYISKEIVKTTVKDEDSPLSNKKFNAGDGILPNATIGEINNMCADKQGNIYIIESRYVLDKLRVRKISKDGKITTLAGGLLDQNVDGIGEKAGFIYASGITVDLKGNVYVSIDEGGIRKISVKTL